MSSDVTRLPAPEERRARLARRFPSWTPMTIAGALDRAVDEFADRPLVITDDRTYTYREVQDWSRRLAAGLVAVGVRPGDHVALVLANHPEFVAIKFAIARTGATCIPINYMYRSGELGYVLAQSDAKVLIVMDRFKDIDHLGSLDKLIPGWESQAGGQAMPELRQVVTFSPQGADRPGAMTLTDLESAGTDAAREELATRERTPDTAGVSDILYTSGTTGTPKGVMLTHDQVVRMAYAAAYSRALEDGRRLIYPMPMYHVFGYMECLMAVLFVGGAVVPLVTFDARHMLRSIAAHGVHEVVAVPAVTLPLVAEARRGDYDISTLHTVFSSGGAAPETIWDDIREVFGDVEITTGYGMTETTAATTTTLPGGDDGALRTTNGRIRDAGAAGDPALGGRIAEYKAVDVETGVDVPPGAQGHLLVRGPTITQGYYKKPEETALAFTDDGWLRTGDLGTIDAGGDLKLTGRLKESLRVGGEMVMPKEIEAVLEEHPGVLQAHVCGVPHERMGEVCCAWVTPTDEDHPPAAEELVALCAERLASYKVPRNIFFAQPEELPQTATGRVQKFRLTELTQQRLQEAQA
jgi:fatty-acyl-CoA synthase